MFRRGEPRQLHKIQGVLEILATPPESRAPHQLQAVAHALNSIDLFVSLPPAVVLDLAASVTLILADGENFQVVNSLH